MKTRKNVFKVPGIGLCYRCSQFTSLAKVPDPLRRNCIVSPLSEIPLPWSGRAQTSPPPGNVARPYSCSADLSTSVPRPRAESAFSEAHNSSHGASVFYCMCLSSPGDFGSLKTKACVIYTVSSTHSAQHSTGHQMGDMAQSKMLRGYP